MNTFISNAIINGPTLTLTAESGKLVVEFVTLNKQESKQRRVCRLHNLDTDSIETNPWDQADIAGSAALAEQLVNTCGWTVS